MLNYSLILFICLVMQNKKLESLNFTKANFLVFVYDFEIMKNYNLFCIF